MQVIETVNRMQETAVQQRSQGRFIGLVATSGAIHAGHLSLVERAKEKSDTVVVSIFVNRKEFGPNEDFDRYPRSREKDLAACEAAGVDIVFIPTAKEMYPEGYSSTVAEERLSDRLCSVSRPHYFRGAATVYTKLFNIIRPDLLVMGERDAQLVAVIRKLIADLNFPVGVEVGGVVREDDGLAMSARNQYLNEFQRRDATLIYRALNEGKKLVDNGTNNVDRVLAEVIHHISQSRRLRVIHVSAVDPEKMEPRREIVHGETLVIAAVWCDEVRLLDCIRV
ncbi:MAG: pantoate--beta-alanine ligase [Opitutales bacterium]